MSTHRLRKRIRLIEVKKKLIIVHEVYEYTKTESFEGNMKASAVKRRFKGSFVFSF